MFDVVIINDDLEKAYEEMKDILNEVSKTIKYPCSYYLTNTLLLLSGSSGINPFIFTLLWTRSLVNAKMEMSPSSLFIQEIQKVQEAKS